MLYAGFHLYTMLLSVCKVTLAIGFSPHLASPEGEGQILSVV